MQAIINPGAEPIYKGTTIENARENIKQLILDCGFSLDEITIFEVKEKHNWFGRYCFTLSRIGYCGVEIDMPGLPLEQVRYLGMNQNIWNFSRLHINGSSFLWKFVVSLAKIDLNIRLNGEME